MKNRGSLPIVAVALAGLLLACGGSSDSGTPGDGDSTAGYDGTWLVTVEITSCYAFTGSAALTVIDGAFGGTLFTYCADPRSGDTYLSSPGCGTDILQTVSIEDGLFAGREVEGNLFLEGTACNGGNGFWGTTSSTSAATATSSWGRVTFAKQ